MYRICAPIDYRNELYVYEYIGYMAEKKKYVFKIDSINNCFVLDLYEHEDWIVTDQLRFYQDYKSRELGIPDQTLSLGRECSVNSCDTGWELKFPTGGNIYSEFNILGGIALKENQYPREVFEDYSLIRIPKNGPVKAGQVLSAYFAKKGGGYEIESHYLQ